MSRRDGVLIPISRIDQLWRGATVINAVGPITVPDRAAFVAAFVALGSAGPHARVGLRFAAGSHRHWLYRLEDLPAYADSCVVRLESGADDDLDALMSRLAIDYDTDRPLRVFLADHHVVTMVSHAIGDSRLCVSLPAAFAAYAHNATMPRWTRNLVDPHPVRSALRHTFPDRASLTAMLDERRDTRRAGVATTQAGGPVDPEDTVEFVPRPVSVTVPGRPGDTREMRIWTRQNLPGAAHFATVLSTVCQALIENGIPCAPGVHMMYDLRRYLPKGHRTTGNFVGGLDLPVPVHDPQAITEVVTRAAKVGRPLAATLAATCLAAVSRLPGYRPEPVTRVVARPQARLALSYIAPTSVEDDLPWTDGADNRMYWCRVDPAGPTAITLLVGVIGKRLQLSASFHATVFDPAVVRTALQSAHDDPIGLLQRTAAPTGPR